MVYLRVSFSRVSESQVFSISCMGSFTSPGIDIRKKGPTAFTVSSERHRQSGVNEIAQASAEVESNYRPLDRQVGALTIRPPLPTINCD